jgi:hypothetical protein
MASDDRSRPQTPPAPRTASSPLEPIKVRELRSKGPDTTLPPPARGGLLKAGPRATGETITIQYEPWQRHHRVRELEGDKVKIEICIPEGWVAYVPEEPGAA